MKIYSCLLNDIGLWMLDWRNEYTVWENKIKFFSCIYLLIKKIYNLVTEKKINKKLLIGLIKNMKKYQNHLCCRQDNTIHASKACIYVLVPQQRWNALLKIKIYRGKWGCL